MDVVKWDSLQKSMYMQVRNGMVSYERYQRFQYAMAADDDPEKAEKILCEAHDARLKA